MIQLKGKGKSSHDLTDDPTLSTEVEDLQERSRLYNEEVSLICFTENSTFTEINIHLKFSIHNNELCDLYLPVR